MKTINIILFGVGKVGSTLIQQILESRAHFEKSGYRLRIPVITNSSTAFFAKEGVVASWQSDIDSIGVPYKIEDIIAWTQRKELDNLVAVDATASDTFVEHYPLLVEEGFHLVAANKVANTLSQEFYDELRESLKFHKREFLYETNVGAGLPVVETLQQLYKSGEQITKVRGVFSGSLSYIFNTFSEGSKPFDQVLQAAQDKGFTEPDPRVDLSGKDVGRKLLILARELELQKELDDIEIDNLVPESLSGDTPVAYFRKHQRKLNRKFEELKADLQEDEVLRHVGELDVASGKLQVKLVKEKKSSPFGSLKNADASFEIYSKSYGDYPLVIQGAGAGAAVTARGVLSDLLKLAEKQTTHENIFETT